MTPTKEKILRKSLALFSERGYSAVRVADIAAAVGVKPPSLYKHYASKQAIFDACAEFFSERVAEVGVAIGLPGSAGAEVAYADVDVEGIVGFATQLFVFYLQDDVAAGFRRMLTLERHREPKLNREFERLFVDGAIEHEERVFAELMGAGLIERRDPHILALRFYTPIFYLLQKYDMRPSEVETAKEELRMIVEEFCFTYMRSPGARGEAGDLGERTEHARDPAGRKADTRKSDGPTTHARKLVLPNVLAHLRGAGPTTHARKLDAAKQDKDSHTPKTDAQKLNAQQGDGKP